MDVRADEGTCDATKFTLELGNDGTATLIVSGFDLVGATVIADTPFEIAPGVSVEVPLLPDGVGTVVVGVLSNDPAGVDYLSFTLEECPAPPVADCAAESPVDVGGRIDWQGDLSYSAIGRSLDYTWALVVQPAESAATLEGTGANRTTLPDVSGTYVAELRVVDSTGLASDPCEATVVVP